MLQLVQNSAARVVIDATKADRLSMTETRKNLHWLPMEGRPVFKILTLTWKALNDKGPVYLKSLLKPSANTYGTRAQTTVMSLGHMGDVSLQNCQSTQNSTLQIPKAKLVNYGDRAFEVERVGCRRDVGEGGPILTDHQRAHLAKSVP